MRAQTQRCFHRILYLTLSYNLEKKPPGEKQNTMPDASSALAALPERFAHPSVRVLTRELAHLLREMEQGERRWPALAAQDEGLPGLETMQAALGAHSLWRRLAVEQQDWRGFTRTIWATLEALPLAKRQAEPNAPHPATVIALRLVWGAERFAELPTVALKPPPASFLEKLARLPVSLPLVAGAAARRSEPGALERAVATWLLQELSHFYPEGRPGLPVEEVRGFARVVAGCRVVGQLRKVSELEDVAASYLAWARLLRADLQRLTNISSGWWSPNDRQLGRQPRP